MGLNANGTRGTSRAELSPGAAAWVDEPPDHRLVVESHGPDHYRRHRNSRR